MATENCKDTSQRTTSCEHSLRLESCNVSMLRMEHLSLQPEPTSQTALTSSTNTLHVLDLKRISGKGTLPPRRNVSSSPLPGFFDSHLPVLQQECKNVDNALGDRLNDMLAANDRQDEQKKQTRGDQEDELYDALDETQLINVDDGFVTFCQNFKYLGSCISFSLCDDFDIEKK